MRTRARKRRLRHGTWALDVAARARISRPETRLARGWEAGALATLAVILMAFGLITLHSASSVMASQGNLSPHYYVSRQATGVLLGLVVMAALSRVPTAWWSRASHILLIGTILLLALVVMPGAEAIAPPTNGARRWLDLGIRFQPSDPAKVAVAVWTASTAVRKQDRFHSLSRGLAPFIIVWAVVVGLIALEPDLSTAILVASLGTCIVFAAGARIGHFALLAAGATPLAIAILTSGYRRARWDTLLLDPGVVPEGGAFQSYQSLVAIGSGGVTGVGFGEGQQKFGFLPEAHNDFIFAMIGEEWGLVGSMAVILCFVGFVAIAFRISRQAPDLFTQLLAVGLASLIGLQAFLHIGVGLGMMPATGLSLPFISYGRSNLVTVLAAVGILLSIAREGSMNAIAREGSLKRRRARAPAGVPPW